MSTDAKLQKILLLASNPKSTPRLRLGEEVREIENGLHRSKHREKFEFIHKWAARPMDIHRALLDVSPDIVHFAGHGAEGGGLVFEDELGNPKVVTKEAIAGLFHLFSDQTKCVVLSGCYSQSQAEIIAQYIPYVTGTQSAVGDSASIAFAVGFYDALGAGRSFEFSHKLGCVSLQTEGGSPGLSPIINHGKYYDHTGDKALAFPKNKIEEKLGIPFFDHLVDIVKQRVENFSDAQAAYYTGVIITGVEERFALRDITFSLNEQSFTFWFLLKGLSQLDLSRQKSVIAHIRRNEFEHESLTMLAIDDLVKAAGGVLGEHYYKYGQHKILTDRGWELLDQVFDHDELFSIRDKLNQIENEACLSDSKDTTTSSAPS